MLAEIACEALRRRKILELKYDGFSRCVEVHAVGVSKTGHIVMCCWQVRGGSVSNEPIGWKLMKLADVSSAVVINEPSQAPRLGYRKGDSRMVQITCEI